MELLESDGELLDDTAKETADEGDAAAAPAEGEKRGRGRPPKKQTATVANASAGKQGGGSGGGRGKAYAGRKLTAYADDDDADVPPRQGVGDGTGGDAGGQAGSSDRPTEKTAPGADPTPWLAKVYTMFIALSTHYVFAHSVNARDASTIGSAERGDLAKQAYEKGSETVRAVLAVCGGDYRQTYLPWSTACRSSFYSWGSLTWVARRGTNRRTAR